MYSKKVASEARRALGLGKNHNRYKDLVFEIAGLDTRIMDDMIGSDGELVAWALDWEERGHSNALSRAIRERF